MRRVDLLVVVSRHASDLRLVTEGIRHAIYDPTKRPPWWCLRFWTSRLIRYRNAPPEVRTLLSIIRVLRCRAVISSDAYRDLSKAEPFVAPTLLYFVQHGLYTANPHKARVLGRSSSFRQSDITLFSIGEFDRTNYRSGGIQPRRVIPIGTLTNSVYCREISPNRARHLLKSYDLCIIEKGIKEHVDSELARLRLESWTLIFQALSHYCGYNNPRVIVALSNSDNPDEAFQWIRKHFQYDFDVTDPKVPFATYRAVDQSELTIGQASTVLCEALGRRKKVLSIDYSTPSLFNLPGDGIAGLKSPSLEEFVERINTTRQLDWITYSKHLSEETTDLVGPDPHSGIPTINQILRRDLMCIRDNLRGK